jgi:hypothetical protein
MVSTPRVRIMIIVVRVEIGKRLAAGVDDLEAAGKALHAPRR